MLQFNAKKSSGGFQQPMPPQSISLDYFHNNPSKKTTTSLLSAKHKISADSLFKPVPLTTKFVLTGLPGTGKSTTFNKCIELLQARGFTDAELLASDNLLSQQFTATNPIIAAYQKKYNLIIPDEVFSAANPIAAFIERFGEEPAFRDLEEMVVINLLEAATENSWFDLGGKAPLRQNTFAALQKCNIVPIFLYAAPELLIQHLARGAEWQKRANYVLREANDPTNGWQQLAAEHYQQRLAGYLQFSTIIINMQEMEHEKSTAELVQEIFYRVHEFKLNCAARANSITRPFRS